MSLRFRNDYTHTLELYVYLGNFDLKEISKNRDISDADLELLNYFINFDMYNTIHLLQNILRHLYTQSLRIFLLYLRIFDVKDLEMYLFSAIYIRLFAFQFRH